MKRFFTAGIAFLALNSFSPLLADSALHDDLPKLVDLQIKKIFTVERGFDANDTVEVAVSGFLPDTCYKLGKGSAKIDLASKEIAVNVQGFVRTQDLCIPIPTRFLEVIQLGVLEAGDYKIVAENNSVVSGALNIAASTSENRDDFLYAPVDTVNLRMKGAGEAQELTLQGTYPALRSGCMRVIEIKAYTTGNQVLIVQPIAKILPAQDCGPGDADRFNHFEVKMQLDSVLLSQGLVHVRTLSGRAINQFVDLSKPVPIDL